MRDPSLDKDTSAGNFSGHVPSSAKDTGEASADGLDYEIEAILQRPEVEESPFGQYVKDCPLCKGAVHFFFINFNEKVAMCENSMCSWPFGYEDPVCVKHNEALSVDDEVESLMVMSHGPVLPTGSIISTMAWSEIDKSNKGLDSEEPASTPIHHNDAVNDAKLQEVLKQKEADQQTRKNLQDIKKLNVQLQKTYEDEDVSCIRNEKWIKHLNNLQSMSGVKLLRKEEMALLKPDEVPHGLTMNIDTENTSIVINLAAPSTEPTVEPTGIMEHTKATVTESIPVIATESIPVIATESIPVIATESIPEIATESIPVIATESIPVIATESIPVIAMESIPVTATKSIPVIATESIPVIATESMPVIAKESIPVIATESISVIATDTIPVIATESIPVIATESIPVIGPTTMNQTMGAVDHVVPKGTLRIEGLDVEIDQLELVLI